MKINVYFGTLANATNSLHVWGCIAPIIVLVIKTNVSFLDCFGVICFSKSRFIKGQAKENSSCGCTVC